MGGGEAELRGSIDEHGGSGGLAMGAGDGDELEAERVDEMGGEIVALCDFEFWVGGGILASEDELLVVAR